MTIYSTFPNSTISYIIDPDLLFKKSSELASTYDILVACGGDGTVQTVAKAASMHDKILGVVPVGSGNDFAKSLFLKLNMPLPYYLNKIKRRNIIQVDLPLINERLFINTAGIGLNGLTNKIASDIKWVKGRTKYMLAAIRALIIAKPFNLILHNKESTVVNKVWLIVIANGSIEGGKYLVSPNSVNTDQKLELTLVHHVNKIRLLILFLRMNFGGALKAKFTSTYIINSTHIQVDKLQYLHIDGEVGESVHDYHIDLPKIRLKVLRA